MPSVYILEDDDSIRDLVLYALKGSLDMRGFAIPSDFWRQLRTETPDLFLLDIMLPEEDGISVLKTLKAMEKTRNLPVIMLTAKKSEFDRAKALDSGAADYVTKPFSILDLISRISTVLQN